MNLKNKNWKTTLAGLGAILISVGVAMQSHFDGNPETVVNWEVVLASLVAGVGLLYARDGDKSSAQLAEK